MKILEWWRIGVVGKRLVENIKNEDGFALPYALLVTILIITLLSALAATLNFNNYLVVKRINKKKCDLACESALQIYLSDRTFADKKGVIFTPDSVRVELSESLNGLFRDITAGARYGGDSSRTEFTIGYRPLAPFDNAVIVSQKNVNLTAAGQTHIFGNVTDYNRIISRGNIFGIRSTSEGFLQGEVIEDKNIESKTFTGSLLKDLFNYDALNVQKEINGDFTLDTLNVHSILSNRKVSIDGDLYITGNISSVIPGQTSIIVKGKTFIESGSSSDAGINIYSDSSITFPGHNNFTNGLFVSKSNIEINGGCEFKNVQFYSLKNIDITNSLFNYPSAAGIFVNTSDKSNYNNSIELKESVYNGTLLLISSVTGMPGNKSKIYIDDKSRLQGVIYSENRADVRGKISGAVYTYNFRYYKDPTEYINWLVNVNINRTELDKWYLLPAGFAGEDSVGVLSQKWSY